MTVYIYLYFSFRYTVTIIWKKCIKLQSNSLPVCSGKRVARSLLFSVVFCRICLSFSFLSLNCLSTTYASDYPFGVFNFVLLQTLSVCSHSASYFVRTLCICMYVFSDPGRLKMLIFGQSSVWVCLKYPTRCDFL